MFYHIDLNDGVSGFKILQVDHGIFIKAIHTKTQVLGFILNQDQFYFSYLCALKFS
jgi:hypothetical protein